MSLEKRFLFSIHRSFQITAVDDVGDKGKNAKHSKSNIKVQLSEHQ